MSFTRPITARQMSYIALVIWCCSLPLTGLVAREPTDSMRGILILLICWLSPLIGNFAWFANVFFLRAVIHLIGLKKTPRYSAFFAVLLSLDTFRLSSYPRDEGGGTGWIYGYGWGAVLWFVAIFVMVIATAMHQSEWEKKSNSESAIDKLILPISFALITIAIGFMLYFSVHDRRIANPAEAQRLSDIAFKRGKVCSAPDPVITDPIRNLHSPVELIIEPKSNTYSLPQIDNLLQWGIPTVRYEGNDYSYTAVPGILLSSVPATGTAAATLFLEESGSIRVTLVENGTNRAVFDSTWEPEKNASNMTYCPNFSTYKVNEQPGQAIRQALDLHASSIDYKESDESRNDRNSTFKTVQGTIIDRKDGDNTRSTRVARYVINCPHDITWGEGKIPKYLPYDTQNPLILGDRSYYLSRSRNAICEDNFIYLYNGNVTDKGYYLNIKKRSLQDLRIVWSKTVVIPVERSSFRSDALIAQSIKTSTDSMTLELVDKDTGNTLFVQAPLSEK